MSESLFFFKSPEFGLRSVATYDVTALRFCNHMTNVPLVVCHEACNKTLDNEITLRYYTKLC